MHFNYFKTIFNIYLRIYC